VGDDDAVALDEVAEVGADVGGADLLDQGGPRGVDRTDGGRLGLARLDAHGRHLHASTAVVSVRGSTRDHRPERGPGGTGRMEG